MGDSMSNVNELFSLATKVMSGNIDSSYDADTLLNNYQQYINIALEFKVQKTELMEIIGLYQNELKEYINSNYFLKEIILYDGKSYHHELDFDYEVDLDLVFSSIFDGKELSGFDKRARDIIIFETMHMINLYGMEPLRSNHELITKEIAYGIFYDKSRKKEKNYEEIMRLGDKYGKEALDYLLNLDELHHRIESIMEVTDKNLLPELANIYSLVEQAISTRNNINSIGNLEIGYLKYLYEGYEKINKTTIISLMADSVDEYITEPTGELLMLHFIQDEKQTKTDIDMNEFLMQDLIERTKSFIAKKNNREYDEEVDHLELEETISRYRLTRKNPFDLQRRIALRSRYKITREIGFADIITEPTTLLSVSISTPEDLSVHLARRIAIGFLPQDVTIDAIKSTSTTFNSEKDRYDFLKDSHSIVDIMQKNKTNTRANETLVDWTRVKPSYILVVKDKEILEPEILQRAQELQRQNNLPIKIYDQYTLSLNKPVK